MKNASDRQAMHERTAAEIRATCVELADFLVGKNKSYGDAALNPIGIFGGTDPIASLGHRIDENLARIRHAPESFGEDTLSDLIGRLILLKIARARRSNAANRPVHNRRKI